MYRDTGANKKESKRDEWTRNNGVRDNFPQEIAAPASEAAAEPFELSLTPFLTLLEVGKLFQFRAEPHDFQHRVAFGVFYSRRLRDGCGTRLSVVDQA